MDPQTSASPPPPPTPIPPQNFNPPPPPAQNPSIAEYPFVQVPYGGDGSSQQPAAAAKKRPRGRPRKYSPDGTPFGAATSSPASSRSVALVGPVGGTPAKRRGRPPGSGKKQLDAIGSFGVGFTPHVITVNAGEDIASKILAFSQQGPRTVCILSANGSVSNVTLRQPSISGGTMTYEGRYEIISLSGSYLLSENNGTRSRTGGLSVSLAGPDGHVLGGGVAGVLRAAVPVQVIVGSFIADGKKPKSGPSLPSPTNMQNLGAPLVVASPPSQVHSSGSEEENGNNSFNGGPIFYNDNGNASQAFHVIPVHPNLVWPNPTAQILPQ